MMTEEVSPTSFGSLCDEKTMKTLPSNRKHKANFSCISVFYVFSIAFSFLVCAGFMLSLTGLVAINDNMNFIPTNYYLFANQIQERIRFKSHHTRHLLELPPPTFDLNKMDRRVWDKSAELPPPTFDLNKMDRRVWDKSAMPTLDFQSMAAAEKSRTNGQLPPTVDLPNNGLVQSTTQELPVEPTSTSNKPVANVIPNNGFQQSTTPQQAQVSDLEANTHQETTTQVVPEDVAVPATVQPPPASIVVPTAESSSASAETHPREPKYPSEDYVFDHAMKLMEKTPGAKRMYNVFQKQLKPIAKILKKGVADIKSYMKLSDATKGKLLITKRVGDIVVDILSVVVTADQDGFLDALAAAQEIAPVVLSVAMEGKEGNDLRKSRGDDESVNDVFANYYKKHKEEKQAEDDAAKLVRRLGNAQKFCAVVAIVFCTIPPIAAGAVAVGSAIGVAKLTVKVAGFFYRKYKAEELNKEGFLKEIREFKEKVPIDKIAETGIGQKIAKTGKAIGRKFRSGMDALRDKLSYEVGKRKEMKRILTKHSGEYLPRKKKKVFTDEVTDTQE